MRSGVIFLLVLTKLSGPVQAQTGTYSIAGGPLISFPTGVTRSAFGMKPGIGLEAVGQYHLSTKSSLLLQTSWSTYNASDPDWFYVRKRLSIFSLHAGYQYNFGSSGFFSNFLTGIEKSSSFRSFSHAFRLGAGRRFLRKNAAFIDAGIDYTFWDTHERINLKALISIFQRP